MKKKGFTLMEVLFVLLIVALVASFAVPAIRSVRYDVRNSQAKTALKKLLAARRSFYQNTKGLDVKTDIPFEASATKTSTCNVSLDGIPSSAKDSQDPMELFGCGFANWKDFVELPYVFQFCDKSATPAGFCADNNGNPMAIYAVASDTKRKLAGEKYYFLTDGTTRYYMAVGWDGQIYENLE